MDSLPFVFPLLTRKPDSCCCLENAIFQKNSWNFTSLWWQHLQIYDWRPSFNATFNSQNLSRTEEMFSCDAFAPNKSQGWFFTTMFSLQVRQTRVAALVGVFGCSAMLWVIWTSGCYAFVFLTANRNWPWNPIGQGSRFFLRMTKGTPGDEVGYDWYDVMMLSAKWFPDLYVKMGLNQSKWSKCTLRMLNAVSG